MFIAVNFTEKEIEQFQKQTEEKNKLLQYNNYDIEFKTRWIGTACEEAFKFYLDSKNIPYTYHATQDKIDNRDFTILDREIDVKGISTTFYPKMHYVCNVSKKQWDKMMKPGNIINHLVFARFNLRTNDCYLLGGISKERFKEIATFCSKGTSRGSIIISTDSYDISIDQLTPMERYL